MRTFYGSLLGDEVGREPGDKDGGPVGVVDGFSESVRMFAGVLLATFDGAVFGD